MSTDAASAPPTRPGPPAHPEGRTRFVYQQWVRDPDGPLLTKPPPTGVRPPNGIIWGHTLADFFWLQRLPNVDVLTIWSRSMIKEHGENYDEGEFAEPDALQVPRRRCPWPVLRVPDALRVPQDAYGVVDEGCARHAQPDYAPRRRDEGEPGRELEARAKVDEIAKVLGLEGATELFVPNDPHYPLRNPDGFVYALLWSFRAEAEALGDVREGLPAQPVGFPQMFEPKEVDGELVIVELDAYGIYVEGDETGKFAGLDGGEENAPCSDTVEENTDETKEEDTEMDTSPDAEATGELSSENVDGRAGGDTVEQSTNEAKSNEVESTILPGVESAGEPQESKVVEGEDAEQRTEEAAGGSKKEDAKEEGENTHDEGAKGEGEEEAEDEDEDEEEAEDESEEDEKVDDSGSEEDVEDDSEVEDDGELEQLSSRDPIPLDSPFSVTDIPKLEEFIPRYYFPDVLYVHDPHRRTSTTSDGHEYATRQDFAPCKPLEYRRVFPKLPRDGAAERDEPTSPARVAHLHLAHQNRLGVGNHSLVHRAALTLPAPLSAHSRTGSVAVAAKSAFAARGARELLANEARMYDGFPAHMAEDWCGYNLVTPVKHPVPVGPVVPKCFGYYVPVRADGRLHKETDVGAPSPVLLLEECGTPVRPEKFCADERSECYSMMLRLHYEGFTQGSFYVRNIMVQPGPLTAPPEQRSKKTPSFRVIDFGRGARWNDFVGDKTDKSNVERKQREWGNLITDEDRRAQRELQIEYWNY